MFEIRHAGKFVHREANEAQAQEWAKTLAHLDEVTVSAGRPFEVYADDVIADTFNSFEEAEAYAQELDTHQAPKLLKGGQLGEIGKRFETIEVRTSQRETLRSETPTEPAPAEIEIPEPELTDSP